MPVIFLDLSMEILLLMSQAARSVTLGHSWTSGVPGKGGILGYIVEQPGYYLCVPHSLYLVS